MEITRFELEFPASNGGHDILHVYGEIRIVNIIRGLYSLYTEWQNTY